MCASRAPRRRDRSHAAPTSTLEAVAFPRVQTCLGRTMALLHCTTADCSWSLLWTTSSRSGVILELCVHLEFRAVASVPAIIAAFVFGGNGYAS